MSNGENEKIERNATKVSQHLLREPWPASIVSRRCQDEKYALTIAESDLPTQAKDGPSSLGHFNIVGPNVIRADPADGQHKNGFIPNCEQDAMRQMISKSDKQLMKSKSN